MVLRIVLLYASDGMGANKSLRGTMSDGDEKSKKYGVNI